jgi:hypothetical protein
MRIQTHIKVCTLALLIAASVGLAQKPQERPRVHSDFTFGSYPVSRDAINLMSKDQIRFMAVAFHEGWSFDKVGKELKLTDDDVDRMFSELDTEKLAKLDQYNDPKPNMPVIREKDIEKIKATLQKHSQEFTDIIAGNWSQIETMAASLTGASGVQKDELMYEIVVAGILLGGMNEVFYEDKTLIPPGPRRGRGQSYYAWLAEGDPRNAGRVKREQSQSDTYTIVTVGPTLSVVRPSMNELRSGKAMILDETESRRMRSFVNIFCKDKLLPYFKSKRSEMMKAGALMSSGKYTAFGEFLAWYYNQIANNAADEIVAAKRMKAPTDQYAYAVKTLQ